MPHWRIVCSRRRCSMARKRASMREGPLAELFKATEAAQRQAGPEAAADEPGENAPEPAPAPRLQHAPRGETGTYLAMIRVVGVGGAGLNALNRMIDAGISQVEFVAVNTDIQQLQMSDATLKIHIGRELTAGLGSGADASI